MAKRQRYEFTSNWLAEQAWQTQQGLRKRSEDTIISQPLGDQEADYVEQAYRDSFLYDIMERGIR